MTRSIPCSHTVWIKELGARRRINGGQGGRAKFLEGIFTEVEFGGQEIGLEMSEARKFLGGCNREFVS